MEKRDSKIFFLLFQFKIVILYYTDDEDLLYYSLPSTQHEVCYRGMFPWSIQTAVRGAEM